MGPTYLLHLVNVSFSIQAPGKSLEILLWVKLGLSLKAGMEIE